MPLVSACDWQGSLQQHKVLLDERRSRKRLPVDPDADHFIFWSLEYLV